MADLPWADTQAILSWTVKYYAVYPGGRRCEVSLESLERNKSQWESEGLTIETDVVAAAVPAHGKVNLVG